MAGARNEGPRDGPTADDPVRQGRRVRGGDAVNGRNLDLVSQICGEVHHGARRAAQVRNI